MSSTSPKSGPESSPRYGTRQADILFEMQERIIDDLQGPPREIICIQSANGWATLFMHEHGGVYLLDNASHRRAVREALVALLQYLDENPGLVPRVKIAIGHKEWPTC